VGDPKFSRPGVFDQSTVETAHGKKRVFWGFLDRKALENAEGVRRKVTTGSKGGAKGFQSRQAYRRVL